MRTAWWVAVSVVLIASGAAAEEAVTVSKRVDPLPGTGIEVAGFAPGMTADAVRDMARQRYSGYDLGETTAAPLARHKALTFRLAAFPAAFHAASKAKGERVEVAFGSPASGSQAVAVRLHRSFARVSGGVTAAALAGDLTRQYGPPAADTTSKNRRSLTWLLTSGAPVVCAPAPGKTVSKCPVSVAFRDEDGTRADKAADAGIRTGVRAEIVWKAGTDTPTGLTVTLEDYANRKLAAKALDDAVAEEGERRSAAP
jgi:hypothetical protein